MKRFLSAYDQRFSATEPESSVCAASRVPLRHRPSGALIPAGTEFTVLFGKVKGQWALRASAVIEVDSEPALISIVSRHASHFFTPPDLTALAGEELHSGTCPSVLGETVEPDGCDEHGSPSWLVALGFV